MDNGDQKGFLRLLDIWKAVRDSIACHTERSEVSKVCESKINNESMTQERMGESHRFAKSQRIVGDSQIAKMDSSRCRAQNDESMDCFGNQSPHNDGVENDLNEWKLIIVGDGVLKGEIESKICALNLGKSVLLKPFTKDIEREYLSASIYAMASHFEGFPMVLLESTSYGLAPISFDIATGPSEIIEHNKSGFLIADNDLESYANHLIKLMRDESMRIAFGNEAKKIVEQRFSKEVIMEKWREVFEG